MNTISYENGQPVKSHSTVGIISLTSSCIAFLMPTISLFFPNMYVLLRHNKALFKVLATSQLLLIGVGTAFSLIDMQKKNNRKLFPVISLVLIGVLVLTAIKSLKYNNLL